MPKITPLIFDPANAFISPGGITPAQIEGLKGKLDACRAELLAEDTEQDLSLIHI